LSPKRQPTPGGFQAGTRPIGILEEFLYSGWAACDVAHTEGAAGNNWARQRVFRFESHFATKDLLE
jgi:hypothetical protein